tara:strand:+ start:152 stop:1018 length:867 start_codon:yes stop_codon:yes gene_type:complete
MIRYATNTPHPNGIHDLGIRYSAIPRNDEETDDERAITLHDQIHSALSELRSLRCSDQLLIALEHLVDETCGSFGVKLQEYGGSPSLVSSKHIKHPKSSSKLPKKQHYISMESCLRTYRLNYTADVKSRGFFANIPTSGRGFRFDEVYSTIGDWITVIERTRELHSSDVFNQELSDEFLNLPNLNMKSIDKWAVTLAKVCSIPDEFLTFSYTNYGRDISRKEQQIEKLRDGDLEDATGIPETLLKLAEAELEEMKRRKTSGEDMLEAKKNLIRARLSSYLSAVEKKNE